MNIENGKATVMYGEIVEATQDFSINFDDGSRHDVKPGDKAIIGFDGMLYQFSEDVAQPMVNVNYDGFSSFGLARFLALYLDINLDIGKKLSDTGVSLDMLCDYIREGLVRIGMNDDLEDDEPDDEDY